MPEAPWDDIRSGDALMAFGTDLTVVSWNKAAEELTGIAADEVIGRPCWDVLGGADERGSLVCHAGCSGARLAAQGWPVCGHQLTIKTKNGRRPVTVSTITLRHDGEPLIMHLMRNGLEEPLAPGSDATPPASREPSLTPRQLEVLGLLAEGAPAKVIARRLDISETTVRNHIRMILLELGCHSQLQAVAEARKRRLLP